MLPQVTGLAINPLILIMDEEAIYAIGFYKKRLVSSANLILVTSVRHKKIS
ncbi:MAG: hypothetical protein ACI9IP_002780 [Arcticibacterium sp.]|jgi:hypothetical protein